MALQTTLSPELLRQLAGTLQQGQGQGQEQVQPQQAGGFDPASLQALGFAIAQALDPEGFGGRLAAGARPILQSGILAEQRGQQQQTLADLLRPTPDGVAGPTKVTLGADGKFTATGDLQTTAPQAGAVPQSAAAPVKTQPQQMTADLPDLSIPTDQAFRGTATQPSGPTPAGGPGMVPLTGAQRNERRL
jgi:hypothetical protein